jgi:peptide-methionine (R)-S-oxide reductase
MAARRGFARGANGTFCIPGASADAFGFIQNELEWSLGRKRPLIGVSHMEKQATQQSKEKLEKVSKTDAEWRQQLSDEEYQVTRKKGTEPAFRGKYWNTEKHGVFECVCCGEPLFDSSTKFDSGTGWPSFYAPMDDSRVELETDESHGMVRTEVMCRKCEAHLGHVFPDGPKPTGLRFCINSAALKLKENDGK